ncbi:MAG: hypothetical protein ABUL62_11630 [Myxococcales bacterium]
MLALSLFTIAVGAYMAFLRPPLLPEDVRALGVDPAALPPSLMRWLSLVFATWGAFITALGVVLFGVASALWHGRPRVLRWSSALAIVIAFGRFFWSNLVLRSDFLWFIALLFLLALFASVALIVEDRNAGGGRK